MSKNLHPTILPFIQDKISKHSAVLTYCVIPADDYYFYRVLRKRNLPDVVVWLSDAYEFTRAEFLARPRNRKIDYILIARPELYAGHMMSENWEGIGVGNLAGFMGALNYEKVCNYSPPHKE